MFRRWLISDPDSQAQALWKRVKTCWANVLSLTRISFGIVTMVGIQAR